MALEKWTRAKVIQLIAQYQKAETKRIVSSHPYDEDGVSTNKFAKKLEGANLSGLDLSNLKFTDLSLHGCYASSASFYKCDLSFCNFTNSDLANADFQEANITGTSFTGANLTDASFLNTNTTIYDYNFNAACIRRLNLKGTHFQDSSHKFIGEVLLQEAQTSRQLMLVGLVGLQTDYCWISCLARLFYMGFENELDWAITVLNQYDCLKASVEYYSPNYRRLKRYKGSRLHAVMEECKYAVRDLDEDPSKDPPAPDRVHEDGEEEVDWQKLELAVENWRDAQGGGSELTTDQSDYDTETDSPVINSEPLLPTDRYVDDPPKTDEENADDGWDW